MSDHEYDEEVAGNAIGWAEIPSTTKALRACKRCSLVKGNDQVKPKAHDHAYRPSGVLCYLETQTMLTL